METRAMGHMFTSVKHLAQVIAALKMGSKIMIFRITCTGTILLAPIRSAAF